MRPANVERLALLVGASPTQAYALASQHQHADVRPWLAQLLRADLQRLRAQFEAERVCPDCGSKNTTTLVADTHGIRYGRGCRACFHQWRPQVSK